MITHTGQSLIPIFPHLSLSSARWSIDSSKLFSVNGNVEKFTYSLADEQVFVQIPTYADNLVLPAFVRRTPLLQKSIVISCLPGTKQQTGRTLLKQAKGTDRRADGRTPYRFTDRTPHTMRVAPLKLRPYCAIQICLLLLLFILGSIWSLGMTKIRSITKYYKISWNDLPSHQQSSHEAEQHWSVESMNYYYHKRTVLRVSRDRAGARNESEQWRGDARRQRQSAVAARARHRRRQPATAVRLRSTADPTPSH